MASLDQVIDIVERILDPVYLVGGSVRDSIMHKSSPDFDFTSPLLPDDIEQRVKEAGYRTYLVGKRFGTIGFTIDGQGIEVTTHRFEKYLPGNRKPKVEYVTELEQDLSRRDFTINAMALRKGELFDPFKGQLDIEKKIIRTVGKAIDRFQEDPLRMLRAARFAAQLQFTLDSETAEALAKQNYHILSVSKERWVQELDALLLSDKPSRGLEVLASSRLLNFILPELSLQVGYDQNSPYHQFELWEHTKKVVDKCPQDIVTRWTALLHDVGKPFTRTQKPGRSNYIYHDLVGKEIAWKIGSYLHFSNERLEAVSQMVGEHMKSDSPLRLYDNESK